MQLTVHQQDMLAVLTHRLGIPAEPDSVARALPQYTKQHAAMLVGSLWSKGYVSICTTERFQNFLSEQLTIIQDLQKQCAVKPESEVRVEVRVEKVPVPVDEASVRKYLLEHKEFADAIVKELAPPPPPPPVEEKVIEPKAEEEKPTYTGTDRAIKVGKLQKKYILELNSSKKVSKAPLILKEFNQNFLERFGHLWDGAAAILFEEEEATFVQGNIIRSLQQDNLDKLFKIYVEEMNIALRAKQDYVLDFYNHEDGSPNLDRLRYIKRDIPVLCKKIKGVKHYSFNREKLSQALKKLIHIYLKHFPSHGTDRKACLTLLGLSEGFTAEDLKKAYRTAAMKHHPDRGGDTEMFQRINAANTSLEATL